MSRALFTIDNWTQNIRGRGWQKWACIGFAAEDAPSGTGTLHFLTLERNWLYMVPGSQVHRSRVVQAMRRFALFGLVAGALTVGTFLLEVMQGRSLTAPSLAFVILSGAMFAVAIRILLPSYPQTVQRRFAREEGMTEEQRKAYLGRVFRKQLFVIVFVLLIEVPVAALSWSIVDWRPFIVGAVGTTVIALALLGLFILRHRKTPPK